MEEIDLTIGTSRRRAVAAGLLVLGLTTVGLAPPAASAPPTIGCGSVITTSTTLAGNVGPCSRNNGLVVGADGVTLDLNGFGVLGRANKTGEGAGILIRDRTGVTVRNGRVVDFDAGVAIVGGSANTIENLLAKDNIGTTKRGDFGDGIVMLNSSGNRILGNDVVHNGPFSGISLVGVSTNNHLEGNVITDNNVGNQADDGIRIEGPGARENVVRSNTVAGSGLDGIAVFSNAGTGPQNDANLIEGNTVTGNGFALLATRPGDGIRTFIRSNGNIIRGNRVTGNAGSGILIPSGSLDNLVTGNTSLDNARQASSTSPRYDLHDTNQACDNNVWSGNTFGTANQACAAG